MLKTAGADLPQHGTRDPEELTLALGPVLSVLRDRRGQPARGTYHSRQLHLVSVTARGQPIQ